MSTFTFELVVPNEQFVPEPTIFVLENITRHIPFFKRGVSVVTFNVKNVATGKYFHDLVNDTTLFHMLLSPALPPQSVYTYLVNAFKMQYGKDFSDVPTDFILARLKESAVTQWDECGVTVTYACQVEKIEIYGTQLIVSDCQLHYKYIKDDEEHTAAIPVSYINAVAAKLKLKMALEKLT